MNKLNSSKVFYLLSAVIAFNVNADITLDIDRDLTAGNEPVVPILPLSGSTQYQIGASQINMNTKHGIICNRIETFDPISNVHVRVLDPNGDNKGDYGGESLMGIQSNINYSLSRRALILRSENRSKSICLSAAEFDVIFKDGYTEEPIPASDITYNYLNQPANGYLPGSTMSYELSYQNNTGSEQTLDFIEYYPYTTSLPAYFDPGKNISCKILDANDIQVPGTLCFSASGVVKDVTLLPTHKVRLEVTRQVGSGVTSGARIEMMAAAFPKVSTIDGIGANYSFSGFDMTYRLIPIAD